MSSAKPDRSQAKPPSKRRLRGYAFDPSLSVDPNTRGINHVTYAVRWEELRPGPVGEYLEVMDHDPLSGRFYEPVTWASPHCSPPMASRPRAPTRSSTNRWCMPWP
jgi:hypothetical protein